MSRNRTGHSKSIDHNARKRSAASLSHLEFSKLMFAGNWRRARTHERSYEKQIVKVAA